MTLLSTYWYNFTAVLSLSTVIWIWTHSLNPWDKYLALEAFRYPFVASLLSVLWTITFEWARAVHGWSKLAISQRISCSLTANKPFYWHLLCWNRTNLKRLETMTCTRGEEVSARISFIWITAGHIHRRLNDGQDKCWWVPTLNTVWFDMYSSPLCKQDWESS